MKKNVCILALMFFYFLGSAQNVEVKNIYGYLYVFPNELGTFNREPYDIISQLNSQQQFGYNSWRLPTDDELSLIIANGLGDSHKAYMTQTSNREGGTVLLVTTRKEAEEYLEKKEIERKIAHAKSQSGYVDLGLPSGNKWSSDGIGAHDTWERCNHYASRRTDCRFASKSDWEELINYCEIEIVKKGCDIIVTGPNGNSIYFKGGDLGPKYWTSTYYGTAPTGKAFYYCVQINRGIHIGYMGETEYGIAMYVK